jgi:hypothetical protein
MEVHMNGDGSKFERPLWLVILWGAIVLCMPSLSCSRGLSSTNTTLLEGTGLEDLRIDEATVANAASGLGASTADARSIGERGVVELRTPRLLVLSFVPPATGQGSPRLYAVRASLWEPVYTGHTSKGIGFLDSVEAVHEAYGLPDTVWVHLDGQRQHYYQQGVIFTTQHPKLIPPKIYAQARAALGKQPGEGPNAHVVTGIMVVRPFTVTKAAETRMARQQVISSRPETDLLVSEF